MKTTTSGQLNLSGTSSAAVICYEDKIRKWTGLKEDQLLRSAEDRKLWRRFVHKAANPWREDGWRQDKTCHCTQQNRELLLTYCVHCIHRSELVRPSVLPHHCRLLWLVETSCRYRQQAMHTQHTQCTTLGPLSPDINHPAVRDMVWDCQSQDKTGLRPKKNSLGLGIGLARCGLGLASLVLCCETWSCHARRHNDLEGQSNFSSTIYGFSILCLEHYYCGDQQWRSLTWKLNPSGTSSAAAFISSGSYTAPGDHYQQTPGEPWLLHSSPVELITAVYEYCLLPVVLVLLFWSGHKNLVLFYITASCSNQQVYSIVWHGTMRMVVSTCTVTMVRWHQSDTTVLQQLQTGSSEFGGNWISDGKLTCSHSCVMHVCRW